MNIFQQATDRCRDFHNTTLCIPFQLPFPPPTRALAPSKPPHVVPRLPRPTTFTGSSVLVLVSSTPTLKRDALATPEVACIYSLAHAQYVDRRFRVLRNVSAVRGGRLSLRKNGGGVSGRSAKMAALFPVCVHRR